MGYKEEALKCATALVVENSFGWRPKLQFSAFTFPQVKKPPYWILGKFWGNRKHDVRCTCVTLQCVWLHFSTLGSSWIWCHYPTFRQISLDLSGNIISSRMDFHRTGVCYHLWEVIHRIICFSHQSTPPIIPPPIFRGTFTFLIFKFNLGIREITTLLLQPFPISSQAALALTSVWRRFSCLYTLHLPGFGEAETSESSWASVALWDQVFSSRDIIAVKACP